MEMNHENEKCNYLHECMNRHAKNQPMKEMVTNEWQFVQLLQSTTWWLLEMEYE